MKMKQFTLFLCLMGIFVSIGSIRAQADDNCAGAQQAVLNNFIHTPTNNATNGVNPSLPCHGSGMFDVWRYLLRRLPGRF
jgi:hypothetical protein